MATFVGVAGVVLFFGVFVLLIVSLRQTQRDDNRNSNPGQSNYEPPPPGG